MIRFRRAVQKGVSVVQDDSGIALASTVLVSAILFLLVMTVLALVSYRESQTSHYTERTQAMHVADAGINEYMYRLSQDYTYYQDPAHPGTARSLGPTQMEGGSWVVTATPPTTNPDQSVTPLTLYSVGTLADGTKRRITSRVGFPTTAKYVFFTDQSTGGWGLGLNAIVYGPVHTNGNIYNQGIIKGTAEASKICYVGSSSGTRPTKPSTAYPGGWVDNAPSISFSAFTQGVGDLKTTAQSTSTWRGLSGTSYGYQVVMDGAEVVITKVTGINYKKPSNSSSPVVTALLGELQLDSTSSQRVTIPSTGVFYFDDNIYVRGTYSANVTIGSAKIIYINGNINTATSTSPATCGLVASDSIYLQYWADSVPSPHIVKCAMLATSPQGTVGAQASGSNSLPGTAPTQQYNTSSHAWEDYIVPGTSNGNPITGTKSLTLYGSMASATQPSISGAYSPRNYNGDERLKNNPPPMYPKIPGFALQIDSWLEN
ncbi:MAG: hypothetical protein WCJ13_06935 [Coriobacteriia bacterium]